MREKWREWSQKRAEARDRRRQQREHDTALAQHEQWKREFEDLSAEITGLTNYEQLVDEFTPDCPIITKRGEEVITIVRGVCLTETRRGARTSYGGTSHGMSIRLGKNVSYRPSMHRGTIEPAPEETKIIDGERRDAVMVITNQRAVFRGNLYSREFRWDKLISATLQELKAHKAPVLMMPVENRQKTSGILLDGGLDADLILSRVLFSVSLQRGRSDLFLQRLKRDLAQLKAAEPEVPAPPEPDE